MQAKPEKTTKPRTPWKKPRGPIRPDPFALELARTINGLLAEPIGVLPRDETDTIRPFAVGLGTEIRARIRPEASAPDLAKALRRYAYSPAYLLARAQPDAMRHDLGGQPVEPVSERDRIDAMDRFHEIRERSLQRRAEREAARAGEDVAAKTD